MRYVETTESEEMKSLGVRIEKGKLMLPGRRNLSRTCLISGIKKDSKFIIVML